MTVPTCSGGSNIRLVSSICVHESVRIDPDGKRDAIVSFFGTRSYNVLEGTPRGAILDHLSVSQRSRAFWSCSSFNLHARALQNDPSIDPKKRVDLDVIVSSDLHAVNKGVNTVTLGRT